MPRAIISVYDKSGLTELAKELINLGWDIVASGGTRQKLEGDGLPVTPVEALTGVEELLGGRVKTLHPAIHAGILARNNQDDDNDLAKYNYAPVNMVICNLYPFQKTVAEKGITLQDAVEQIDIGGVTLLRAAAKNFMRVASVCDPADYPALIAELSENGEIQLAIRRNLAIKAFAHTREYDTAIHAFLSQDMSVGTVAETLPEHLSVGATRAEQMRYGENPHQNAAYYSLQASQNVFGGELLGGKALSYNNILDVDAAWRATSTFTEPTVVIVKHLTPTGVATHDDTAQAYKNALASDPISAFGGIIAVNRQVDEAFVEAMDSIFVEAVAAPGFTTAARELMQARRKNCRLLRIPQPHDSREYELRSVHRGILVQQKDMGDPEGTVFKTMTNRAPTEEELLALQFAWKVVGHVKSNAIVLAHPGMTIGVGGGLPSRVDAAELAIKKAGERAQGAVMASDAFFPFADGLQAGIDAGITAVVQPGGSIRDKEVIAAANEAGIAMVFTGVRHFRH